MRTSSELFAIACALGIATAISGCAATDGTAVTDGRTSFATPDEAMQALFVSSDDPAHADALLGPGGADLLCDCDAEAADDLAAVHAQMAVKLAYADDGADSKRVLLGEEGWELPLRLVRVDGRWRFDLGAGEDELLCRSVGGSELRAIATLRELVDAQHEYWSGQEEDGVHAYARRWCSTSGKHDGLFWETEDGAPSSPLGPGFCRSEDGAATESGGSGAPELSVPFHGYRYRILAAQKQRASGGDGSLADGKGRLTKGFAIVAWPVDYAVGGVTTFQVNDVGVVFQKDLGADTAMVAAKISEFDPDGTWTPVRE